MSTPARRPGRAAARRATAPRSAAFAPRGCPRTSSSRPPANRRGDELVAEDETGRVERVGRVRRRRLGADLTPTVRVVGHDADEQRLLVHRRAPRGAERLRRAGAGSGGARRRGRVVARRGSVNATGPGHSARAHEAMPLRRRLFSAAWRACAPVPSSRSSSRRPSSWPGPSSPEPSWRGPSSRPPSWPPASGPCPRARNP